MPHRGEEGGVGGVACSVCMERGREKGRLGKAACAARHVWGRKACYATLRAQRWCVGWGWGHGGGMVGEGWAGKEWEVGGVWQVGERRKAGSSMHARASTQPAMCDQAGGGGVAQAENMSVPVPGLSCPSQMSQPAQFITILPVLSAMSLSVCHVYPPVPLLWCKNLFLPHVLKSAKYNRK